jgi:hypothetical protein
VALTCDRDINGNPSAELALLEQVRAALNPSPSSVDHLIPNVAANQVQSDWPCRKIGQLSASSEQRACCTAARHCPLQVHVKQAEQRIGKGIVHKIAKENRSGSELTIGQESPVVEIKVAEQIELASLQVGI